MMKKNNKKCIVCGEIYTYCPSCEEFARLPKWYLIYHNENCKKLFDITSQYEDKDITKEEAEKLLSECDLSYKGKLHPNILKLVNECSSGSTLAVKKMAPSQAKKKPLNKNSID